MTVVRCALLSLVVALGAAVAACGQFTAGADLTVPGVDNGSGGSGTTTGVGGNIYMPTGGGGGGSNADAGGDYVPVVNDSYSYLCGSMQDVCLPGSTQPAKQCEAMLQPDDSDGGPSGVVSCTIVLDPNASNTSTKSATLDQCLPRGSLGDGDPCNTATDCSPGLGCVKSSSTGVCRPYCCGALEGCNQGTYCQPLPMREASQALVPVCVPADNCTLLDDSTCTSGKTCTVVRMDGTTSCVYPGTHTRGEPCPCAAGYVCSQFNATCAKLCELGSNAGCDDGGICTAGSTGYPDNVGICGGYAAN